MDSQNRLKMRISRMLRSSFGSCKSRNISDVIERPTFEPRTRQHHQLIELFSPGPRLFPSSRPPKCPEPETPEPELRNSCGQNCPPASPISPLLTAPKSESEPKQKKAKNKRRKKKTVKRANFDNYYDWFSSDSEDEDDDQTTFFSSKSLSSDSSDCFGQKERRRRALAGEESEAGDLMPLQGKAKDSFAVVKRSSDPYGDFRKSMVEMIVERQIFGAGDLERLLQTFLSLNSSHHHRVIVQVFTEIWEALFSDCS